MRAGTLADLRVLADDLTRRCAERWEPAWTSGECRLRAGQREESVPAFEEALARSENAGDAVGLAASGYRLGWIAYRQGRFEQSEARYSKALPAAVEASRSDLEAQLLNGLAGLYLATGRMGQAHESLGRSVEALQRAGLQDQARRLSHNRAILLLFLGDAEGARRILEPLHQESVDRGDGYLAPRVALTLGNLFRRTDEPEAARRWYDRVPEDPPDLAGLARLSLGRIALDRGDFAEAARVLEAARELVDPGDGLLVDAFLAEADLGRGEIDRAIRELERVIAEADRVSSDEAAWIARGIAAEAAARRGDRAAALGRLREAVAIVERGGSTLDPFREGLRFLRERSEPFVDLAARLCGKGIDDPRNPVATEIVSVVEKLHARALRRVIAGGKFAEPPALEDLQRGLASDELLLDFAIGRDRGVVVAVRSDRFRARVTPGWSELARPLTRYRAALIRPLRSAEARLDPRADLERSAADGRRLASALIGPIEPLLQGVRRIYFVPDRQLALVPPAAIPWPPDAPSTTFLGHRYETAVLPLAGRSRSRDGASGPLLLAGDPLPDDAGRFPALPRAAEELREVENLWSGVPVTRLAGERLTAENVQSLDLASYGTIHFTTHAVASTADPTRCAVHLSRGERLGLDTISGIALGSPLVVLSACRTGEGELIPGEGVVGLAWAFLRAGADEVAASLWNVDDESATELMVAFHRLMRQGADPVAAMAEARREVAVRRPHPAYWAAFVVMLRPAAGV